MTKTALFGYFWLQFEKAIVIFEINTLENLCAKTKDQKLLCLGVCGLEFENPIVIFEISTLKFV